MFFFPKLFCNFCAIFLAKSEWKGEKSEICGWLDPGAQSLRGNRLFWSYLIFMNNFPDISSAPWSCPLFHCYTMMSWRGSDEDQTGPRLRILSLSLSLQPVRKHGRQPSIALSLQSNLHKNRSMCSDDVWICVSAMWEKPLSQFEWKCTTFTERKKKAVWISNGLRCFSLSPFKKSSVLNMLFAQSGFVPELHC